MNELMNVLITDFSELKTSMARCKSWFEEENQKDADCRRLIVSVALFPNYCLVDWKGKFLIYNNIQLGQNTWTLCLLEPRQHWISEANMLSVLVSLEPNNGSNFLNKYVQLLYKDFLKISYLKSSRITKQHGGFVLQLTR